MFLTISTGKSRKATEWKPEVITWESLVEKLRSPITTSETMAEYQAMEKADKAEAKDVGGFIGGKCENGSRKAENISKRQLIALDADFASLDFWDEFTMSADYAACMYSTHSHTPTTPRYRLLIPLSREVTPTEYEACARMIAKDLGIEQFDDTTYEANRLMYWPSVCADGLKTYEFNWQSGEILNPDSILSRYENWHDQKQWPRSERTAAEIREKAKKAGEPTEKPGIIGAFCRVYDIDSAISTYLSEYFDEAGDGRYTYHGGTTFAGCKVFDGKFLYSWHTHDPYHGRLLNAFDLVRLHLYGHLDTDNEMPMADRPSYKAMRQLCSKDDAVKDDLIKAAGFGDESADVFLGQYTDQDICRIVADRYGDKLMFHESIGWLRWDGKVWRVTGNAGQDAVMETNNYLLDMAKREEIETCLESDDKDEIKAAQAKVQKLVSFRSSGHIFGIEKLLKGRLALDDVNRLDPNPWDLNTPEGIIDLRTGEIRPNAPEAMCSHITFCGIADGPSPMWSRFLSDAAVQDKELIDYLQLVAGMGSVGKVYEEGLIIVHGPGGNGKSTMFNTLDKVLGDYAGTIRSSTLMERKNGSEPYGIEDVRGRRLVIMGELDEGARMSVSTMKSLTSRDDIQANPKFKQIMTFSPTHKLILHTNHLPKLGQLDYGTKRRIAIVPFTAAPKQGKERIPDLTEQMVEKEGAQILRWICEGARRFYEAGCQVNKPRAVVRATEEYIAGEDWMRQFIEERCEEAQNAHVMAGELYAVYRNWAEETGQWVRRGRDFAQELESRGFEKKKTMKGNVWFGLKVKERDDI